MVSPASTDPEDASSQPLGSQKRTTKWLSAGAWILALGVVSAAILLAYRFQNQAAPAVSAPATPISQHELQSDPVALPALSAPASIPGLSRTIQLHTIIPNRPRQDVREYLVGGGDTVFGIASKFGVKPETVLWANYDLLNDDPHYLSPGMELHIPPVDGVYYQWQEGDSLEGVAARFQVDIDDILEWPGNHFDLVNPEVEPGLWVMIPGGFREFRQWLVPTIPRGAAGVSKSLYGPGACDGAYDGAFGSGAFIYPVPSHALSGNDYWSGHLGIDLAAGTGTPARAADSGVVVFSGWAYGGYGNMVVIDHGNGYQTLYAHLSQASVSCGRSVAQGQVIGLAGNTGNSTGPHLHFEVRFQGGFVSPWFVLPAP